MDETARKIIVFMKEYKQTHAGRAPSIRRIGCEIGLSTHKVVVYLYRLAGEGKIIYDGNHKNMAINLLDTGEDGGTLNDSFTNEAVPPDATNT